MLDVFYLWYDEIGNSCSYSFIYFGFPFRCLRFISQSWQSFAEFSISQLEINDGSNKRRKLSDEDGGFISGKAFEDAKKCLVSLKNTLEDLHRKKKFPYNPKALLRRFVHSNTNSTLMFLLAHFLIGNLLCSLSRFQVLCGH
jgi:Lines C-terminus